MKLAGNYLILLLVLLHIGGGSLHASNLPEIKKEQPFSSEKFAAANPLSGAYCENLYQEISELLKILQLGGSSVVPGSSGIFKLSISEELHFSFARDLRKNLQIQLFPKHFFL